MKQSFANQSPSPKLCKSKALNKTKLKANISGILKQLIIYKIYSSSQANKPPLKLGFNKTFKKRKERKARKRTKF